MATCAMPFFIYHLMVTSKIEFVRGYNEILPSKFITFISMKGWYWQQSVWRTPVKQCLEIVTGRNMPNFVFRYFTLKSMHSATISLHNDLIKTHVISRSPKRWETPNGTHLIIFPLLQAHQLWSLTMATNFPFIVAQHFEKSAL